MRSKLLKFNIVAIFAGILVMYYTDLTLAADRLVYETFEDQQWSDSFKGTFNPENVSIVSMASPHSGDYVARMYGGYLGAAFDYNINAGNNSEFYIKYYQYFPSSDWNWTDIQYSAGGIKQLRPGAIQGDGWPLMTWKFEGRGAQTHCYYSEGKHPSGIPRRNLNPFPTLNTWHKVEIYLKYSDYEGGYYWKVDDVLIAGVELENFTHDVWPPPFGNVIEILRFAGGNGFPDGNLYYIDDIEIWDGLPESGLNPPTGLTVKPKN